MINFKNIIYSLFCLFYAFNLSAVDMNVGLLNVEWQKNVLEADIKKKIENKLEKVLVEKIYTVDIEIKTTIPKKPSFKQTPPQPPESIKFTNAAKASPGDYIVFSKFGLESPISANMDKKESPQNSEYEYMWKFQESQSIYNNLESIKATISLPENLNDEQRKYIEDIVRATSFNLKDFTVQIEFKYVNLKPVELFKPEPVIPEDKGLVNKETLDLIEKLASPVGMIIASLLLGLFSVIIFKKYAKLRNDILQRKIILDGNTKSEENSKNEDESDNLGAGGMLGPSGNEGQTEDSISGINRFKMTLRDNPDLIYLLIKNWIRSGGDEPIKALVFLLDKLETIQLHQIFDNLSISERGEWKTMIESTSFSSINPQKVEKFISTQIINNFIVPDVVTDNELKNKLLSLNEDSAIKFIKNNNQLAAILLSVSPTHLINKIMVKLSDSDKGKFLMEASKFDISKSKDLLSQLSLKLNEYTNDIVLSPFMDKLIKLIPTSRYQDEDAIYKILFDNQIYQKIESIALDCFPSSLVAKLSEKSLNKIFMSFSMTERVDIIECFDEESIKAIFISSFAKEGTAAYDMYQLEIEKFSIDENQKIALSEKADEYKSKLFLKVRSLVRSDEEIKRDAKLIVGNWIESNMQVAQSKPELKVA